MLKEYFNSKIILSVLSALIIFALICFVGYSLIGRINTIQTQLNENTKNISTVVQYLNTQIEATKK